MKRLKNKFFATLNGGHLFHRAVYAGLAISHGSGCIITEKPELYGPMALLYSLLALKG